MTSALVIASIDRAGDHAVVIAIVALIAAVGGLVYGLIHLVAKGRADRTRSGRDRERVQGPEA